MDWVGLVRVKKVIEYQSEWIKNSENIRSDLVGSDQTDQIGARGSDQTEQSG